LTLLKRRYRVLQDGEVPIRQKRTFQALRIAVNNELGILAKTIEDGTELLKPGGRFCIITFHSLEDRIVKDEFNKKVNPCICPKQFPVCTCGRKPEGVLVNRKPIVPKEKNLRKIQEQEVQNLEFWKKFKRFK